MPAQPQAVVIEQFRSGTTAVAELIAWASALEAKGWTSLDVTKALSFDFPDPAVEGMTG